MSLFLISKKAIKKRRRNTMKKEQQDRLYKKWNNGIYISQRSI